MSSKISPKTILSNSPEIGKVEKLSSYIGDIRPQTVSLYMQGKDIRQMYVGVIDRDSNEIDIDISEMYEDHEFDIDVVKEHLANEPQVNVRLTSDSSVETKNYNIAEYDELMKHTTAITGFDVVQGNEKLYDGTGKAFYNTEKEKDILAYLKVNAGKEQYEKIEQAYPKSRSLYIAMTKYDALLPSALRETANVYAKILWENFS